MTCVKNCLEDGTAQYTQYAYDPEGNKIRQFTGMTEPLEITLAEGGGEDAYTYADIEYHIEVSGGNKKDSCSETKYAYNEKNELVSMTDPEGNTEKYRYDEYGNQTGVTDKNGNTTVYTYDYQGRVLSETAADAETGKEVTHTYEYDSYGNLVKQDGVSYTYDKLTGMVQTETEEIAGKEVKKEYTYDSGYNCTSFTVSVGGKETLSLSYEYDGFSRLSKVKLHEGGRVTGVASYTYDEDGNLVSESEDGAGLVTDYAYDYAGSLTSMENLTGEGETIASYTASYRLNGQKTSEKETAMTEEGRLKKRMASYTYDSLGRLLTERHTGEYAVTYTYDSHNNRKEMVQGNKTTAYTYDKNDELLRTDTLNTDTNKDTVALYKYDKNGNQLAAVNRCQTESDGTTFDLDVSLGANRLNKNVVNHYDAMNQLTETLTKDKKVQYAYDAGGLRTSKTVNGTETFYVWDGDQIVLELDGKGKVKKRYVRGTNLVFADEGQGTEKTYYAANPHGDVVQLLDKEGTVIRNYEYDAFGNETHKDRKDDNPYRYSGEYYDRETDTIYLRARYYAPAQGRFLTRDTYTGEEDDPLSLHLYTYCENDGVNNFDPSGHWSISKKNGKTHQRITENAINSIKKKKMKKFIKKFNKKAIINRHCTFPDRAKKGVKGMKNADEVVLKMIIASSNSDGTINNSETGKWHGRSYRDLKKLKRKAEKKLRNPNKDKKQRSKLLGCVLHAIEDKYAHSYYSELRKFYKYFNKKSCQLKKRYSVDDISRLDTQYHSDRIVVTKDKEETVTKIELYTDPDTKKHVNRNVHKDYKDNINMDFREEETNPWVDVKKHPFQNNQRVIEAVDSCADYIGKVVKR